MLELIDDALEALFRATVPLAARDIDVSFDAPERDWSAKLTRPTVNLFLWDIRRSAEHARAGVEQFERNGQTVRRQALPRIELRYVVTAWTSDHGDERSLLAGLLRAILAHSEIPMQFVPAGLVELPPMRLVMANSGSEPPDMSKMLEGQLKPGIHMVVVTAIDTDVYTPAGPPVETFEVQVSRLGQLNGDGQSDVVRRVAGEIADPGAIGAAVISPRGASVVNEAGRFVIHAAPGDTLVIETEPSQTIVVPAVGGVRVG